jgi:hypothetical protein
MAENVFIFGAGASVDCGAPLMANFIDVAEDLLLANRFGPSKQRIAKVFEIINELQQVYAKSKLDLINIEALFGSIEMASIINKLGTHSGTEINEYREAMILLISKTLERTIAFKLVDAEGLMLQSGHYHRFVNFLKAAKLVDSTCVLTFNYDVALDFALERADIGFDYGLAEGKSGRGFNLLKLHGSINWLQSEKTKTIVPYPMRDWISSLRVQRGDSRAIYFDMSGTRTAVDEFGELPMIVPPTWNKTGYHKSLTNVWSKAAEALSEARNIYVVGYSLPSSDLFFRYLYALGTMSQTRLRNFHVFDPSSAVGKRFRGILGEGVTSRFHYSSRDFREALESLASEYGVHDQPTPKIRLLN